MSKELQSEQGRVRGIVEETLKDQNYAHSKTSEWASEIADKSAEELKTVLQNRKIVVNVLLMEKNESGFKTYNSAVWADQKDDLFVIRHEVNDIRCIVTVWALFYK
jgi:hypothetical protein